MLQPRMISNFWWTVITQSILWFSLNHFVDEISCFDGPATRYFSLLDLDLLTQNVISDFFTWFANVWSATKHAFVSHNAHGEIINCCCVVYSAHHLRCHIAGCSWSILSVFRPPHSCNTEVSDSKIPFLIDDQVFWLDVSVNDILFVADF